MHPNPEVIWSTSGPIKDPFGRSWGHIHTTMAVFVPETIVPEGAMQGDILIKIHRVGHIFDEVIINLAFRPGHFSLQLAISLTVGFVVVKLSVKKTFGIELKTCQALDKVCPYFSVNLMI